MRGNRDIDDRENVLRNRLEALTPSQRADSSRLKEIQ